MYKLIQELNFHLIEILILLIIYKYLKYLKKFIILIQINVLNFYAIKQAFFIVFLIKEKNNYFFYKFSFSFKFGKFYNSFKNYSPKLI